MKAIALVLVALWIAAGAGRLFVGRIRDLQDAPLERFVYSAALGFGVAAYGILALGLVGFLSFWPVTLWWLVLAGAGAVGLRENARDLLRGLANLKTQAQSGKLNGEQIACILAAAVVLFCALAAILACFVPPNGLEWDALAYHLADPKVFLQQGRITSLPTEHHSNFPFTIEMLFAVGLLYDGYALANLFHFVLGALLVGAMLAFCRRHLSATAGWLAALLFATTPVVLWEASTAYIELGFGLYTTLAVFAATQALTPDSDRNEKTHWILLAGAMMGFALGTKYLALLPFVFVGLLLLARRVPVRSVAIYAAVALAIASPWYGKNILLTHNPVYPFAESVFPHSKYWSHDRAVAYQGEQDSFGFPHSLKKPVESVQNLMISPLKLLTDAGKYSNGGEYTFMALYGGLYAAFAFALLMQRRLPSVIKNLLLLLTLQWLAWFFVAQISRYLVAILPLLAVCCGYAAAEMGWKKGVGVRGSGFGKYVVSLAFAGQVLIFLWGLFVLPTVPRTPYDMPTAYSVPEALAVVTTPDGAEARLNRTLDVYAAMDWLNRNAPPKAGVILYENVLGFYLDRPYLWGNSQHSSYIPYERFADGTDLRRWFAERGYRYALINLRLAQGEFDKDRTKFPAGPNHFEEQALQQWYAQSTAPPGNWRYPMNDAIRRGLWRPVFARNGVIVLEMEAQP